MLCAADTYISVSLLESVCMQQRRARKCFTPMHGNDFGNGLATVCQRFDNGFSTGQRLGNTLRTALTCTISFSWPNTPSVSVDVIATSFTSATTSQKATPPPSSTMPIDSSRALPLLNVLCHHGISSYSITGSMQVIDDSAI
jgi:hypothetical protein